MFDATSPLWLWLVLIFIIFSRVSSADQENITAESGQDVTLTCRAAPNNKIINIVEWSGADLKPEYVFVYRNKFAPEVKHPSFKGRVELKDGQMKGGDMSLILKNLTINDTGTYKCRVLMEETSSPELICSIDLVVVAPPGQPGGTTEDGYVGLIVGLSVSAVLLLLVVVLLISKRCRKQHGLDPKQPPDEQQQKCKEKLLIKVEP